MATKSNQKQKPQTRVSVSIDFNIDATEEVYLTPETLQTWMEEEFTTPRDFNIHISKNSNNFSF